MPYTVPQLPYDYDALAPTIDEATMRPHHDRHHQAYVDKPNAALAGTELEGLPVEERSHRLRISRSISRRRFATTAAAMPSTRCSGSP